jgi:HlyD family type I secretion membrane fusion protein
MIALIAGASLHINSAAAETDVPRLPDIIPPLELSEEDTPPPPIAAPLEVVEVTPPHLLELQDKLRAHPGQRRAEQRVCEAKWGILLGKSNYYPKLNATLSGGRKWVDHTTRSDEFGGSNSPEYDGEGLNATLMLRQHLYDWGRNKSIIEGYKQDRHVAKIEQVETLNEQLATLLRMSLQYVLQSKLIAHFDRAKEIIDRDVTSMEERFKAGAARLAEMRQARLVGLEAEARLGQAERQRDLVAQAMKTQFAISPQQAAQLIDSFRQNRPEVPDSVPGPVSPRARLTLVEAEGEYNAARDEYEAVVANFRAEAARELAEVKTRANQAGAREDAFRAKVRHADVRAPADGIVTAVHVKTVGAVVQAGTVLAEIVPDEQAVLVQARILSEDIGGVYPGQIAQVSLSAYDVSRYGNLEGEVQRIAQNTTQEQNMPPFYETLIAIPKPKLSKSDDEVEIVPGMTVMVDLIGQKRTVLNYIMTPLNRAAGVAFREN